MPFNPDTHRPKSLHLYDNILGAVRQTYFQKDYQYGETWRHMRLPSLTDEIYQCVWRMRQIEDHLQAGEPLQAFGGDIENALEDAINWAVLELIRYRELEMNTPTVSIRPVEVPAPDKQRTLVKP